MAFNFENLEAVLSAQQASNELILRTYPPKNDGKLLPQPDGIVSPEHYLDTPVRVMWILKENHSHKSEGELVSNPNWDYIRDFVAQYKKKKYFGVSRATWYPVIKASWSLQNGFKRAEEIPGAREIAESLNSIAFVNISKYLGYKRSDSNFWKVYEDSKEIIPSQIRLFKPHVVLVWYGIFGQLVNDLSKDGAKLLAGRNDVAEYGSTLLIRVYHPGNTKKGQTKNAYINHIVETARDWFNSSKTAL